MNLRPAAVLLVLVAGPVAGQGGAPDVPEQIAIPEPSTDEAPVTDGTEGEPTDAEEVEPGLSPEARPTEDTAGESAPAGPTDETGSAPGLDSVPLPPARPDGILAPDSADPDRPALIPPGEDAAPDVEPNSAAEAGEPPDEEPIAIPMREALTDTPEELSACFAALDDMGVIYERSAPIADPDNPDCGIANPVTVSEIAPGVVLDPPPFLRCETALAAARWARDVAVPLAAKLGRGDLVAIDQGTATLCRPRADGKMSEHAWGNALDVMGFRFSEGEPIPVEPRGGDGTLEEAFQRATRAGACLDFTTVLGPGSDEDHANHLHLDIRERNGAFRICQ